MSLRSASSDTLKDFTLTQGKIKEFFVKFTDESKKIHADMIEKMPSPYSSAQGTYVETAFERILSDNNLINHQQALSCQL